jgi:phosphoglycolate phosphatase
MHSKAVLFDFDGTLADTAADLSRAVNRLRAERGLEAMPIGKLRHSASAGARGLIEAGLGILPEHPEYQALREAFMRHYANEMFIDTRLFPGIEQLLSAIEARGLRWGIVTNKSARFTHGIVAALGLERRTACVVCGDTTPHLKPHPASLLLASERLALQPSACLYVGDDERDMIAGRAAGMGVAAAVYGYLGHGKPPLQWDADIWIDDPLEILEFLRR